MQVLSAAFFLEFDEDGSGFVDRTEFRNNLWMLTRASQAEKMHYAFARLDLNGSCSLERDDLAGSMRRQLRLVRSILPLLIRHELRRCRGAHGEARCGGGGGAEGKEAALGAEAMALADSMIDGLSAQVGGRSSSIGIATVTAAAAAAAAANTTTTATSTRWTRWWTRSSRKSTSTATAASR